MPSKLRKALGAVKDQTSISLAKVSGTNASNLEVLILKATRHDDAPIDERYVNEVLQLISSSKVYAAACAQAIGKRIGRTRNWVVALKSLMLVLRIFQDGDPHFSREVLHAMKRGSKILNLSSFRDDSNTSPWDYTAFVRTFGLYLDERLNCFITGKLQRRFTNKERQNSIPRNSRRVNEPVRDMKPAMLLHKISYWQKLLDRAIGTRPTGAAKTNRLVNISLYAIVRESFDLYRDISDGLALLLDSFFHLQYQSCVTAFQTCVKASKQFEELCSFYDSCKSIAVGRTSEYPSVQKISDELVETLQEFLKDQSNFANANGRSPSSNLSVASSPARDPSSRDQSPEPKERFSDTALEYDSRCTSLEDLMSVTDGGTSPSPSMDLYLDMSERLSQRDDTISETGSTSNQSQLVVHQQPIEGLDFLSFNDWPQEDQSGGPENGDQTTSSICWDLMLPEPADLANGFAPSNTMTDLSDQPSVPDQPYNPFLQDTIEIPETVTNIGGNHVTFPVTDMFSIAPTFQASATSSAENSNEAPSFQVEDDPFAPWPGEKVNGDVSNGVADQQNVLEEQQLWLQQQDKIIAKYLS
ncbi:clathrin assembly family protein [Tripterygium wilfordii]|uniref:Clathrin assembly family protein n=1 Tax=Tripterygium wilfordii TaxID=458696 RepID=A0A7J7BX69_TRIWF|nr:clathrin coat assembly protein AP180-like [Tripterygium wilfordii]KAF5726472.1 clathrin assembly family protein [Tripterygium wilfordii]